MTLIRFRGGLPCLGGLIITDFALRGLVRAPGGLVVELPAGLPHRWVGRIPPRRPKGS